MNLQSIKTLATLAALALTGTASAGNAPFTMISGATAPGIDVSLTLQASGQPGYAYDFIVSNNSLVGIVTGVYLEADWSSMLSGAGLSTGPALLNPGSLSPVIAGWEGPMASHTVGSTRVRKLVGRGYRDYYYDTLEDGIMPGQGQTFSFVADTGTISLQDLLNAIGQPGYGVAIRMQDLTSDPYAAGWGEVEALEYVENIEGPLNPTDITGVPTPTAAIAGLALLGIVGIRRRRA